LLLSKGIEVTVNNVGLYCCELGLVLKAFRYFYC
jgi:hypothetical protein